MKGAKKLIIQLLSAVFLVVLFTIPAQAASCTCGQSSKPHDTSHNVDYINKGALGHTKYCLSCQLNGHSGDCAQIYLADEEHTLTYEGTGANRKAICSKCGYSAAAPCPHTNAEWTVIYPMTGPKSSRDTCVKYCSDCETVVETKSHAPAYKDESSTQHKVFCKDCGYTISSYVDHNFTYTYDKSAPSSDPTATSIVNSMVVSPARTHLAHGTCKECGFQTTRHEEHNFSGKTCAQCGLTKQILGKVSKVKGKQTGRGKHHTTKITAKWLWDGIRWRWQSAGTAHTYSYHVKLSWKKQKKAYGYVCSVDKNRIKTGTSAVDAWSFYFTRKTSIKYPLAVSRKLKKATFYVAPVDKYGFIGKQKKVTVKLK